MLCSLPVIAALFTFSPTSPAERNYTPIPVQQSCRLNIGCYRECERRGGGNCNSECYRCN